MAKSGARNTRARRRRRPHTRAGPFQGQGPRTRQRGYSDVPGEGVSRQSAGTVPRDGTDRRGSLGDAVWPAACASALLGVTTAMVIVGLSAQLHAALAPQHAATSGGVRHATVVGAALLSLAVGVRMPQRFAMWLCSMAWRRFVTRGLRSDMSDVVIGPGAADRPLYWLAFSVIALVAGILIALLPLSVTCAGALYAWAHANFVWSALPLELLHFAISLATVLCPLAFLGLAVSCAHHLCCRFGQWDTRATAWLMIGAAPGTYIATVASAEGTSSAPALIAAALPALLVSLCAAVLGSSRGSGSVPEAADEAAPLPIWSDRWPKLLRASIVAAGAVSACAMTVWNACLAESAEHRGLFIGVMVFAFGVGVLAGCRKSRFGSRSIGGFGTAVVLAGVVLALGKLGLASGGWGNPVFTGALACAGVAAIGFATAYGRQTLLTRVASRSSVGARILARLLVFGALMVLLGGPLAMGVLGERATLMLLALFLIALGGTLIIHEPGYSPQVRRARLCAVFAAIATMIALTARPLRPFDPPIADSETSRGRDAHDATSRAAQTSVPPNNDR